MLTKTLMTFNDAISAHLIIGKLESAGIECTLLNENFSSLFPQYSNMLGGGIRLMVSEEDYGRAFRIVHESDNRFEGGKIVCPSCHSVNVQFKYGNRLLSWFLILMTLLFRFTPSTQFERKYSCEDCGMRF